MSIADCNGEIECPLCLLPLDTHDLSHPLQCWSRHCQFNCCVECLERLIESAKDNDMEASDGNTFRVRLHCPNCRSNLGATIRDTLLLRKVDKYSHRVFCRGKPVADERLSASELEFKSALEEDEGVALAIEGAQRREDDFFGRGTEVTCATSFETGASARSFLEDLEEVVDETKQLDNVQADPTLLCGLDAFMTVQEQKFLTAQLVSGDTARLAAATEIIHYVSTLSQQGIKPNSIRRERCMLESLREIIREGNEARRLDKERGHVAPSQQTEIKKTVKAVGGMAVSVRNHKKQADMETKMQRMEYLETKKHMEYMKLHPLPLRMPKYAGVMVTKSESAGLTFCNDTWDGSVLDAYSKITVNRSFLGKTTVTKQHAESSGIRRVINAGLAEPNGKGCFDAEKPRVVVASISVDLGRQGVVKGDVVSHFNGEPFNGTASELERLIADSFEGEVLTFAFNADSAVAEALKRRAIMTRVGKEKPSRRRSSRRPVWARLRAGTQRRSRN
mmetsp:Transcript_16127/g.35099  ORF Transcript_16127/g.35099 Transcript_16127/m.35099 type:complete len:506 (-) Transcript_16127:52-1569(-)